MKTTTSPQRTAIRAIGLSLLVASIITGTARGQKNPPAAPAPATDPTAAQPPADESVPAASRIGGNPVPSPVEGSGSLPAVEPSTPADPAAAPGDTLLIDPRIRNTFRTEKDANGLTRTIVRTVLDEEVSGNPQDAVRNYEAVIAAFDGQRANAAQAIFRLGETYRKLNRLDEARVQYARILREFVDFPDLASLSQKQLSQNPPAVVRGGGTTVEGSSVAGFAARAAAASAEERKLMLEEIHLLEKQLSEAQNLVKNGIAGTDSVIPIQREILQLKRQLLRQANGADPDSTSKSVTPPSADSRETAPGGSTLLPSQK